MQHLSNFNLTLYWRPVPAEKGHCYLTSFFQLKRWLSNLYETSYGSVSCTIYLNIPSDVLSCLFRTLTCIKVEETLPLELKLLQWSVKPHLRASKRHLLFEFCEKIDRIWEFRLCFISEVTNQSSLRLLDGRRGTNNVWRRANHGFGNLGSNYGWFIRSVRTHINSAALMRYYCFNFDSPKFNKQNIFFT